MQMPFLSKEMKDLYLPFNTISWVSNKKSTGYEQLNGHKSVKYIINYTLNKVII
jgi:hypothetical protein